MPKFLTFETEDDAFERAGQEGQALNLPYWQDSTKYISKYPNAPFYSSEEGWVLEVTDYTTLTPEEESATLTTINI